ncbi:MAG: hypothetical protein EB107_04905, partial [Proteobacteria bacterium]|nr:hypothetical protein [Pseudomonadota bacterium]
MGGDRQAICLGHRGDFLRFGQATHPATTEQRDHTAAKVKPRNFMRRHDVVVLQIQRDVRNDGEGGISTMKIWPFDQFGPETGGQWIDARQIETGLRPFRQIRDAVGNAMDIALEMHSVWNLPSAIRIAKAVEPFDPLWFEDPIRMDSLDALAT